MNDGRNIYFDGHREKMTLPSGRGWWACQARRRRQTALLPAGLLLLLLWGAAAATAPSLPQADASGRSLALQLVQQQRHPDSQAAAATAETFSSNCRPFTNLASLLLDGPVEHWRGDGSNATPTRFVLANHKSGSMFSRCVCDVVRTAGGVPCVAPHDHGSNDSNGSNMPAPPVQHTRGKGISSTHFCVNMVRNPFVMVHSGMKAGGAACGGAVLTTFWR